jgi:hypothetical protein
MVKSIGGFEAAGTSGAPGGVDPGGWTANLVV